MLKYRGSRLYRAGIIGSVLIVLIVAIGLAPTKLAALASSVRYQAVFTEAGGLEVGDAVMLRGVKVGDVYDISLQSGKVEVAFVVAGDVRLGSDTAAHIKIGSLLGRRVVALTSTGATALKTGATIPVSRTSSPYSLNDAIGDLTTNTAGTDTAQLNQALDTLSSTLDQIAPQLGPTLDGLTRLSRSLNSRDDSLRELLQSASQVTDVLSTRSQQLNSLILNANELLGVLVARRQAIIALLANTSAVARELSGLVADNRAALGPALEKLNSVTAMLEKNRDNIAKTLPGLRKVAITNAEAVSNGGYYNAFVANLLPGAVMQPFIDWAFRLQPRSMIPLPNCGADNNCYNRKEAPYDKQVPHP